MIDFSAIPLEEIEHRQAELLPIFKAIVGDSAGRGHIALTYRCAVKRCALAHIIQTPRGVLIGYVNRPDAWRTTRNMDTLGNGPHLYVGVLHPEYKQFITYFQCPHSSNLPYTHRQIEADLRANDHGTTVLL